MKKEKGEQKAKDEWGAKWFFTFNHECLTTLLTTCTSSDMPLPVSAGKMSIEVGKEGNLHKHIYVVFERSWRKSALLNRFKKWGIQVDRITPGTEQTVINYIGNVDKEVSKGCEVITDYTCSWGDIETTQGQRNDISVSDAVLWQIKDALDAGESLRKIWDSFFPYMVRYGQGITIYAKEIQRASIRYEREKKPPQEATLDELKETFDKSYAAYFEASPPVEMTN